MLPETQQGMLPDIHKGMLHLGLLLGTEAPVMTPNSAYFPSLLFFLTRDAERGGT